MSEIPTKLAERVARARAQLKAHPMLLTKERHPKMPARSRRSFVTWMLEHAGNAGKTRACKEIEAAARRIDEPTFRITQGASQ